MPKKFLRRWLHTPKFLAGHGSPRLLKPLLQDPNLFHLNRHSVSTAFFVGLFCAFLPIPGQTIIAGLLALFFGCNLPISLALIWITNPLTIPPIFFLTYELGRWLLHSPPMDFDIHLSWEWFTLQGRAILAPLLLGSLISGLVFGGLGFVAMYQLWRWTVVRNWENRKRRRQGKSPPPHS